MNAVEEYSIEIVRLILTMTFTGSIVSIFLFAIKPVIKDKLPKTFQYYMWFPVIMALILPLSEIAVLPAWSRAAASVGSVSDVAQWITETAFERPINAVLVPAEDEQTTMQTAAYVPSVAAILFVIWQFGMILVLCFRVTGYVRYVRRIKKYSRSASRQEAELLHELSGGKRVPRLYQNPFVATPVLIGVLRPEIVLPDKKYEETMLQSILVHEMTHMRRHDTAVKWLLVLAGALHWFNPAVRAACREINKACELACDESVIKKYDNDQKQHYGDALITAAADAVRGIPVSITMFEDKKNLKERLEAIMKHSDFSKKTIFISGLLLGIVICAAFGLGMEGNAANPESSGVITYADESPIQRQKHEKELEVKQALCDYDQDNIVGAWVYLGCSDQEITYANIVVVSKDRITDVDELDKIKAVAAERLNLEDQNINLECMDSDALSTQDYSMDHMNTNTDKEQAYLDYLRKTLAETIKEEMGVADCEIDLGYADGEIISAQVSIAAEDGGADISETDIVDYISHALEIPAEDIILYFV